MYIKLKSEKGKVIEAKIGSCWTCLFLFIFAPLVRGDVAYFILYTFLEGVGLLLALYVNDGIGIPMMALVTVYFNNNYNKWFIRGKLNNGWEPETEEDKQILVEKGIIVTEV